MDKLEQKLHQMYKKVREASLLSVEMSQPEDYMRPSIVQSFEGLYLYMYFSSPLIGMPLLQDNCVLIMITGCPMVRGNITCISRSLLPFVPFLESCPLYRLSFKRGITVHGFAYLTIQHSEQTL